MICHTVENNTATSGTIEANGHNVKWINANVWTITSTNWSFATGIAHGMFLTKSNSGLVLTPQAFSDYAGGADTDDVVRAEWYQPIEADDYHYSLPRV